MDASGLATEHSEEDGPPRIPIIEVAFVHKQQRNIDNGRMRTIRLTWILEGDATPQWTGEIPR